MGRRLAVSSLSTLAVLAAGVCAAAAPAVAGPAPCDGAGLPAPVCVGADKVAGRGVAPAALEAYAGSWVHRALALQRALGDPVPFANAPWIGTHNSFNSTSEPPTLSHTDSNQQLTLSQQLDLDVRGLELDLHWVPSVAAGGYAPVVCHGRGEDQAHAGCTTERTLAQRLPEVAAWLRGHPGEVVLLYLEDHLGGSDGHDAAAAVLDRVLGPLLYRTGTGGAAGACVPLPLDVSRDDVLAAGAQVVAVTSGCGPGPAWRGAVFDWDAPAGAPAHVETGASTGYGDDCDPGTFDRATYDTRLVRYFEDSTWLSATASGSLAPRTGDEGITPRAAASMMRCGVDLTGLDQLRPDDGRLEAMVWSWAPGRPRPGTRGCAAQRRDGRWIARRCTTRLRAACRTTDGSWLLSRRTTAAAAPPACRTRAAHAVPPRTGYENELLRRARQGTRAPVWVTGAPIHSAGAGP